MSTSRGKFNDYITAASNMEHILRNGHRIAAAPSVAHAIGNPPVVSLCLETDLQEVATQPSRADGEDTFDGIENLPMSEEPSTSRTLRTHFASSAKLERTMSE